MHPAGVYIGRVESHMKKYENDKMIIFIVFHIFHNFDFFRPEKNPKTFFLGSVLRNSWLAPGGPWGIQVRHYTGAFRGSHRTKLPALIHFYPEPQPRSGPRSGVGPRDPVQEAKPLTPAGQECLQNRSQEECFFGLSGRKKSKL